MTGWSIKGEAGKALDATERTLPSLNISTAGLTIASLASDTLEWDAAVSDATGAGTIIPDIGQAVSLWHNGVRRFAGTVTVPRIKTKMVTVTCEGPWWWMQRINLTQTATDQTGATAVRPSYVFPTQSLKTSLEALIDRMISQGVPIVRGTVDAMFDFPRITLSERTCAQALADLLAICPDAVAWFDYSGAGLPILNVSRRGAMAAQTFTVGADSIDVLDLYPRQELQVKYIELASAAREPNGDSKFQTQSAGTPTTGSNQLVVVSGPETVPFLPKDRDNMVDVQAVPLANVTNGWINANDPDMGSIINDFGYYPVAASGTFGLALYSTGTDVGASYFYCSARKLTANFPAGVSFYVVVSPDRVPEWVKEENGYELINATMSGWMKVSEVTQNPTQSFQKVASMAEGVIVGYPLGVSSNQGWYTRIAFFQYSIQVQLINRKVTNEFSTLKTVYRQRDYDYLFPPAGCAAGLLAAQNWVPWEGQLQTVSDTVDGIPLLNKKIHVAGSLADCAAMGALVKSTSFDLMRGRRTLRLGSPARTSAASLASRFRGSPRDNIIYI